MMQQFNLRVSKKEILKPTLWSLTLSGPDLPEQIAPGQFFLLACGDPFETYLRRAVFPVTPLPGDTEPALQIILSAQQTTDAGLAWLATRQEGDSVNALGPLGNGVDFTSLGKNLLLLGSGLHLGPLISLAQYGEQNNRNVVMALEAVRGSEVYPPQNLPPAIEVIIATKDGRFGRRGSILGHLDDLSRWADTIIAVGERPFYHQLKEHLAEKRLPLVKGLAQALLIDRPLNVCGTGICAYCLIPTANGLKLACADGPFFDLSDLSLEGDND